MSGVITVIQESLYWIVVFSIFLGYAMIRGKQALINLILGLYFALLISLEFPYYDAILSGTQSDSTNDSIIMIVVFSVFTIVATFLFGRLMPGEYGEKAFERFGKKILFALAASVLVMAYSFHALPLTDIITPGSPIQSLFAPEGVFFWWLLLPIAGLFLL